MPALTANQWSLSKLRRYSPPMGIDELRDLLIEDNVPGITPDSDSSLVYASVTGLLAYHARELIRAAYDSGTEPDGAVRVTCETCEGTLFGVYYEQASNGEHVQCTDCGHVHGGVRR